MNIFHAFIFGLVEGLTEFLPVSSTGHLILVSKILGLPQTDFLSSFEITIQLGAILAVIALYGKTLVFNAAVIKRVLAAFIPTAVIGLVFYKLIKNFLFGSPLVVVFALGIGGVVIIVFESFYREKASAVGDLSCLSFRQAVWIGVFQSIAVIPGVSRSAATIIGGLSMGISRRVIVEFSFLLAVPTMAAATALDLVKTAHGFSLAEFGVLGIGFVTSFFVALLAIKFFLRFIAGHNFMIFGIYRLMIALVFFILNFK